MDKNLVLAVSLSLLVYAVWFGVVEKRYLKPQARPVAEHAAPARSAGTLEAPEARGAAAGDTKPASGKPVASGPVTLDEAVTVDAGYAVFQFHRRGAQISGLRFKDEQEDVQLVTDPARGLLRSWERLEFQAKRGDKGSVEFVARAAGLTYRKRYTLDPEGGWHALEVEVVNTGKAPAQLGAWDLAAGPKLGTYEEELKENESNSRGIVVSETPKKKRPVLHKMKGGKAFDGADGYVWAGLDNRYFLFGVRPEGAAFEPSFESFEIEDEDYLALGLRAAPAVLQPGETRAYSVRFFIGPKDYEKLKALGHHLDQGFDFGFFRRIGQGVLIAVTFFYGWTGNYGLSIIMLTILLQLLMLPLTMKSLKAMNAMKKVQPQMQELQKKFKDDPQRLNVEMMQLYKSSGANPLSGCLPMLLQMPIFFALFATLRNDWGLHGAPFVLWITDLSVKDPYYVLPLIMGGVMFVQQKLSPQAGDPSQQKMMAFMPVLFTFMFMNFPAGLVLYWLTSSLINFGQQQILQRVYT